MEQELDERKTKILKIIIRNYLKTGEPVGSRTISKDPELSLSSATIRNEMSDLEEMGYIEQPHTSAGRVPSDKGYRFYVDSIIVEKDREIADIKEMVIEKTQKMEKTLQQAVKALAENTNYTTIISAPQGNKLKFIQLSLVSDDQLLAVIVLEGNRVKNQMITLKEPIDSESVLKLNLMLNTSLNGLALNQINLVTISSLKEQAGIHSGVVSDVLDLIVMAIQEDNDLQVYTSGTTNIFKYPELADSSKASDLITTFEDKEGLNELIAESVGERDEETGIRVYIGDETHVESLKDCSVVTATYELGEDLKGMIGIVGPKRMDYENVVDNLKVIKSSLVEAFRKEE
ncbi:MAG: heat-inducible transcriptional repressor HrcA [Eubacterium sp.]|nr:heat-inducible transcriptional repressor HrcA [Eubacterium sp.]